MHAMHASMQVRDHRSRLVSPRLFTTRAPVVRETSVRRGAHAGASSSRQVRVAQNLSLAIRENMSRGRLLFHFRPGLENTPEFM